jgi:hypothetical protein
MNKFFKLILSVLLLMMVAAASGPLEVRAAAETGGQIVFECPLKGGRIGDPLAFTLRVKLPPAALLEPSSLSSLEIRPLKSDGRNLSKNFFSCEFKPFDQLELSTRQSFIISGVMRFYAPGDYHLAPVSLLYRRPEPNSGRGAKKHENDLDKTTIQTLTSNRIKIRIASLLPDGQPAPALIIPEKEPRFRIAELKKARTRQQCYRISLTLSLLLTLFFSISCYRRRKLEAIAKTETPGRQKQDLAAALRQAVQQKKVDNHWSHLVEIDHLLRRFLLNEANLPESTGGGRGTAFIEHLRNHLSPKLAARLQLIWAEIDRTVALEIENYPDFQKLRRALQLWLKEYSKAKGGRHGF